MQMKTVAHLYLPRFAPDIERGFQAGYYIRVRSTLRLVSGLLTAAISAYALLGVNEKMAFVGAFNISQLLLCLLLFGLTWAPGFNRIWQTVTVGAGWVSAILMFGALAAQLVDFPPPLTDRAGVSAVQHLFFTLQVCVFMVTVAAFRLTFVPAFLLQCGVVLAGTVSFMSYLTTDGARKHALLQFFEPVILVLLGVLLASYVQEKLARGAFEFNRRLSEMQIQEHVKRVETENMLHVLNGAIGSIVHDLGNPLTSVQTGAELTREVLRDEHTSLETLRDLNSTVLRGVRMLSFLRVSLIEQSRVLEGKPVPVELRPISVQTIVEAGSSFQHLRLAQHTFSIEGEDVLICADEMKMVTVLMNLIGNALKYSDGAVCVSWQSDKDCMHLAVLDSGKAGRGLTQEQAARLFTPFGRLEEHTNIEGTGLGLLSVQKIVQAHGGQTWIEGYENGTANSPCFSTRNDSPKYSSPLSSPYLTAFVITCPLAP